MLQKNSEGIFKELQNILQSLHIVQHFLLLFLCGLLRFVLPPHLTLKNFEGLDLGKMDKVRRSE